MDNEIIINSPIIKHLKAKVEHQNNVIRILTNFLGVKLDSENKRLGGNMAKQIEAENIAYYRKLEEIGIPVEN